MFAVVFMTDSDIDEIYIFNTEGKAQEFFDEEKKEILESNKFEVIDVWKDYIDYSEKVDGFNYSIRIIKDVKKMF